MDIKKERARSRGLYLNPYIGDLQRDLVEAIYKCQYWDKTEDNSELVSLLQCWCDYTLDNWHDFEKGTYRYIRNRPLFNFKQLLTQDLFVANVPDVEKDQQILKDLQKELK